jgi:penicillin V acylase-like amidase (Ntn superfamily)
MRKYPPKLLALALSAVIVVVPAIGTGLACTRTLYVGADNTVITGRNMDWMEDMISNLWVFPAGIKRDGAAGPQSIRWTSKYGSVVVSGYEAGSSDGLNEEGLVANLLYLAQSDYGQPDASRPFLSIAAWPQYVLDNYASVVLSVQRAVSVPLGITTPAEPNIASTLWRTVSDQKNLVYYFDSATRPNTFWVSLAKLNLRPGASVKKLTIQNGEVFSGEISDQFEDAAPFKFLKASPPPA